MINLWRLKIHTLPLSSFASLYNTTLQRVSGCDEVQQCVGHYFLELLLTQIKMLRYSPSHLAAAAMYLSNKVAKIN